MRRPAGTSGLRQDTHTGKGGCQHCTQATAHMQTHVLLSHMPWHGLCSSTMGMEGGTKSQRQHRFAHNGLVVSNHAAAVTNSPHAVAVCGVLTRPIGNNKTPAADVHSALQCADRRSAPRGRCNHRQQLQGPRQAVLQTSNQAQHPCVLFPLPSSARALGASMSSLCPKRTRKQPATQWACAAAHHQAQPFPRRRHRQKTAGLHRHARQGGKTVCTSSPSNTHTAPTLRPPPPVRPAVSLTVLPPASKLPGTRHTGLSNTRHPAASVVGTCTDNPHACHPATMVQRSTPSGAAARITDGYTGRQAFTMH